MRAGEKRGRDIISKHKLNHDYIFSKEVKTTSICASSKGRFQHEDTLIIYFLQLEIITIHLNEFEQTLSSGI